MLHITPKYLFIASIIALLSSCATNQYRNQPVSAFLPIDSAADFEGTYLNEYGMLAEVLFLNKKKGSILTDEIDFVTLSRDEKNKLTATYHTENRQFSTTIKRKKNSNYFKKSSTSLIPFPPIYMQHDHREILLGTDSISDLLLYYWHRGGGMILMVGAGGADQRDYRFNRFIPEESDVWYPCQEGDKWGYKRRDRWMIPPQYEYARLFQNNLARVKKNGKWGIIRKDGTIIAPFLYDKIDPFYIHPQGTMIGLDPPVNHSTEESYVLAKVYRNGKEGYINNQGQECIPAVYSKIKYFDEGVAKAVYKGRKVTVSYKK